MYKCGDYGISIEQIDGFGKNPGLWIHHDNVAIKVASFGNFKKAAAFDKYLDWFFFGKKEPEDEANE